SSSPTPAWSSANNAATCFIDRRTGVWPGSVQVPGPSLSTRLPTLGVWLSHGLRGPGIAGMSVERLKRGLPCSKQRGPPRPGWFGLGGLEVHVGAVVIGMDPHKRSATIEVMDGQETVLGGGRFGTDTDGFTQMLAYARQFPERTWAIEGCQGIGAHLA